jgi:hypothetical protein
MSALSITETKAPQRPTKASGTNLIHGIANGSNRIPDSPESAGFFEAMKNTQEKSPKNMSRNTVAAMEPLFETFITGTSTELPGALLNGEN